MNEEEPGQGHDCPKRGANQHLPPRVVVKVDATVGHGHRQSQAQRAPHEPPKASLVSQPERHEEGHVSGHKEHELRMGRWHSILFEELGAVPHVDPCKQTKPLFSLFS